MSELLVEIHAPLTPSKVAVGEYEFPWIEQILDYLMSLDGSSGEYYDDGEEVGDEYLFFVHNASESELIDIARAVAALEGVPAGVFATVTDTKADMGGGRRVELN